MRVLSGVLAALGAVDGNVPAVDSGPTSVLSQDTLPPSQESNFDTRSQEEYAAAMAWLSQETVVGPAEPGSDSEPHHSPAGALRRPTGSPSQVFDSVEDSGPALPSSLQPGVGRGAGDQPGSKRPLEEHSPSDASQRSPSTARRRRCTADEVPLALSGGEHPFDSVDGAFSVEEPLSQGGLSQAEMNEQWLVEPVLQFYDHLQGRNARESEPLAGMSPAHVSSFPAADFPWDDENDMMFDGDPVSFAAPGPDGPSQADAGNPEEPLQRMDEIRAAFPNASSLVGEVALQGSVAPCTPGWCTENTEELLVRVAIRCLLKLTRRELANVLAVFNRTGPVSLSTTFSGSDVCVDYYVVVSRAAGLLQGAASASPITSKPQLRRGTATSRTTSRANPNISLSDCW